MSEPENAATIIELGSCANSEFVKWIEYAYTFSSMLDYTLLTDAEKEMVRLVLNMKMGVGE